MNTQKEDTEYNKTLWEQFLSGDDSAYAKLYSLFVNKLFLYGMHFTSDRELVKDCTQDVFIKIYENRHKLKPVHNVKVYLYTSMKNALLNLLRLEVEYSDIDSETSTFHTDSSMEDQLIETERLYEQKKEIVQITKMITPRQREILYYRYIEELPYEDICKLMQMNYQSVRNLAHRAILKIRNTVKNISIWLYFLPGIPI